MGFWDKAKKSLSWKESIEAAKSAKESLDEMGQTDKYDDEDAREFTKETQHDIDPSELRRKIGTNVPLDYLDEGEQVQYFLDGFDLDVDGDDEGMVTVFLVTDQKLVFLAHSATGKSSQYTVSYSDIIGISTQQRFTSQIQIETAGHSYKVSAAGSQPEIATDAAEYIRKRKDEIDAADGGSNEGSALDELDKLNDLREKGAISEEEYEEKKQELLDDV